VIPRAWLFDLDGTLVESVERFYDAYCETLAEAELASVDTQAFLEAYRAGTLASRLALGAKETDAFWRRLMERFVAGGRAAQVLPGVEEALGRLSTRGCRIAVVTGRACPEEAVWADLQAIGVAGHVDSVTTAGEVAGLQLGAAGVVTKSHLLARACTELGAAPDRAALVTDWPAELVEGLELGLALCVGVLTGGYRREDFPVDARVRTIRDLTELGAVLGPLEEARAAAS
jgi:phosphoglycolate phosphatase-like HAD superfamily hydrolase